MAKNLDEPNKLDKIVGVQGIDNDISFGKNTLDAEQLLSTHASYAVYLPPVIDTAIFQDIMKLKAEDLEEDLTGLQSPEEIVAAKSRLSEVQGHCRMLKDTGAVIDPDQWHMMIDNSRFTPRNSYFARERIDHWQSAP